MVFSAQHLFGVVAMALTLASSFTQVARAQDLCSLAPGSYAAAKSANPTMASAISEVEKYSVATWYNDVGDYAATIRSMVSKCPTSSRLSIVVYGIPNKDCEAGYSKGTNKNAADYERYLNTLTGIIGSRKVLYVLEPDAVGLLGNAGGCAETSGYRSNLQTAIRLLSANANADIYLDVGYWKLEWPDDIAKTVATVKSLVSAGRVKGIMLNTSNYRPNSEISTLCSNFQNAMGSAAYRCVVDTSRNYNTPSTKEWCNVKTAGIGLPPTATTGIANLDYFMWIKVPGESDGLCNDGSHDSNSLVGPNAGMFFPDHFKLLWDQGYFVKQRGFPKIGAGPSPTPAPTTPGGCAASGAPCGSNAQGAKCCAVADEYCQPWNPDYYQCRPGPVICGKPLTNVDFYGGDIATLYGLAPNECCAKCADTVGCKAYTFVNYNSDGRSACYLKNNSADRRSAVGAISAEVISPKPSCSTAVGGVCGTSQGTTCCPSGQYCQPWNSGYYQCINTPPQCAQQLTNTDLYGNDLATITNIWPSDCCDRCAATTGCRAYTFVNEGTPTCYLKSGTGDRRTLVGAISGVMNF